MAGSRRSVTVYADLHAVENGLVTERETVAGFVALHAA
ncbi:Uncharacterized protein ToN1_43560 [Aromatoleum petrolei]|nr:Uncharacterized protein ToN1_43560 [Aromatoleum petrolei]